MRNCCHDLLVHVIAVLLETGCYEFIGRLLARRWLVRGSMLAFVCFCSGEPGKLDKRSQPTVSEFVRSHAGVNVAGLVQAELLLLVAGMNLCERLLAKNRETSKAARGFFCWSPCLLQKAGAIPPLAFFRKTENPEGMEDFLSCLGFAPTPANVARLKETAAKYLDIRGKHLARTREDLVDFLNLANWHDFSDS